MKRWLIEGGRLVVYAKTAKRAVEIATKNGYAATEAVQDGAWLSRTNTVVGSALKDEPIVDLQYEPRKKAV